MTVGQEWRYNVDSIRYSKGDTVITGWVARGEDEVSISLTGKHSFDVERCYRGDVVSYLSDTQKIDPMCGFEVYVRGVYLQKIALDFSSGDASLHVKVKDSPSAFGFLKYCLKGNRIGRGVRYLQEHGLRAFWSKLREVMRQEQGVDYMSWYEIHKASAPDLAQQREKVFAYAPLISVVVPTFNTPESFLSAMVDSVLAQSYTNFELCLADGSTDETVFPLLEKMAAADERIKVRRLGENLGISGNTNAAIEMAHGEYVALLDHDDLVTPDALFEVVQALNVPEQERPELIYTDEDKVDADGVFLFDPQFKPDFAPYTFRNNNYICHFTVMNKALMEREDIHFSTEYNGAQDYDIILRMSEKAKRVVHIPRILYHWRVHQNSTASGGQSVKPYTHKAGKRALRDHLKRMGIQGEVIDGSQGELPNVYRVRYAVMGQPMVSIIIPNCNQRESLERCIKSVMAKTQGADYEILVVENNSTDSELFAYYKELEQYPQVRVLHWEQAFNYSAINNFAAKQAKGDYLVLMNNDIEVISDDWLTEMLGICQQPDVGVVGAKLYYEDHTVQHSGVIVGMTGIAGHCYQGSGHRDYGYGLRLTCIQNFSAVTGALMMVKHELYQKAGGLDEDLAVAFNDIDFCLRIRQMGYFVIEDPYAEAYHYESVSRGSEKSVARYQAFEAECDFFRKRWGTEFRDPYYNPNMALNTTQFKLG